MTEDRKTVLIGGEEVDLSKIPPLTIGHKRRLFKEAGVSMSDLGRFTPEQEFQFVWFVVKLLRPQTTEAEMEAVSLRDVMEIALGTGRAIAGAPDVPTFGSSPT